MFALYNIATVLAEIPFGIIRKKNIKFFGVPFLSRKGRKYK